MIPISEALRKRLRVIKADITTLAVDAIVNSADADLLGGGEVDKAIHRAAGPELRKACRTYVLEQGRCFAGGASLTKAFNLPCRYVIHAVGPSWVGGADASSLRVCTAPAPLLFPQSPRGSKAFPSPPPRPWPCR